MNFAYPTYTKFKFCITGPCFIGKTILFDYSYGDPLLLQVARSASCFQMPRPPAGHDEEAQQGRQQEGSAHASLSDVFAVTMGVTLPYPMSGWMLRHPV